MKRELERRLAGAGFRIMHDGDQHEVIAIRESQIAEALGKLELDALYRFHCLGAEARAQALRLTENRESFILRDAVTQQVYAECRTLDEVGEMIERRNSERAAARSGCRCPRCSLMRGAHH